MDMVNIQMCQIENETKPRKDYRLKDGCVRKYFRIEVLRHPVRGAAVEDSVQKLSSSVC